MNTPHPSGRIRWALLCLALAAAAARTGRPPAASSAAPGSSSRWTPGAPPPPSRRRPRRGRQGHRRAADHQRLRRQAPRRRRRRARGRRRRPRRHRRQRGRAAEVKPQQAPDRLPRVRGRAPGVEHRAASRRPAGVGVAVIDTGIAGRLPDFRPRRPRRVARHRQRRHQPGCRTPATPSATARTSRASSPATAATAPDGDPLHGRYVGIAPEANLISVKVSDDEGEASVLDVIYGLQFVVDNKAAYNIRVVNLSLESTTPGSYKTDPLERGRRVRLVQGHRRRHRRRQPRQRGRRGLPRARQRPVRDHGRRGRRRRLQGRRRRRPPGWSSRGITRDGFAKPEIHAPGAGIVSTLAPNSKFARLCADLRRRRPDDPRRRHLDGGPDRLGRRRAAPAEAPAAHARPGQGPADPQLAPAQQQVPRRSTSQRRHRDPLRTASRRPTPASCRTRSSTRDRRHRLHPLELEPLELVEDATAG